MTSDREYGVLLVPNFVCSFFQEPCSAVIGQGKKLDKSIRNGMSWLVAMIIKDWESLKTRVADDVKVMKQKQAKERKEKQERVRKIREERYD